MELKYGENKSTLHLPKSCLSGVVAADFQEVGRSPEEIVGLALDSCGERLSQLKAGDKVVIVTSDITRYTGSDIYLPLLVDRLNAIGVRDEDITVIIALGIHRRQTEHERARILGCIFGRVRVKDHDCDDPGKLVIVGKTTNGIEVAINRQVAEAAHLILTGTIGFHYFAGFGGGRKSILPGVASRSSCMASHFAVLNPAPGSGKNPLATTGILERNPVHEAMVEACAMVDPMLMLNTVLSPQKQIIAAFAGDWQQAHVEGCRYYAEKFSFPLAEKADLVVVSCGGFPKDINVIQAHKSMEYGSKALKDGGVMILLAECRDGYGNATFFNWFRFADLAEFEAELRKNYEINGQTAYSLAQKAQRFRIILVSILPDEEVRTMGLYPAATLEEAVNMAVELLPDDFSAYLIPEGGAVLPVIKERS